MSSHDSLHLKSARAHVIGRFMFSHGPMVVTDRAERARSSARTLPRPQDTVGPTDRPTRRTRLNASPRSIQRPERRTLLRIKKPKPTRAVESQTNQKEPHSKSAPTKVEKGLRVQNPTYCLHIHITSEFVFFLTDRLIDLITLDARRDRRRRKDGRDPTFRHVPTRSDDVHGDDDAERGGDGAMRDDAHDGKSDTKECWMSTGGGGGHRKTHLASDGCRRGDARRCRRGEDDEGDASRDAFRGWTTRDAGTTTRGDDAGDRDRDRG